MRWTRPVALEMPQGIAVILNAASAGAHNDAVARQVGDAFAGHQLQPRILIAEGYELEGVARRIVAEGIPVVVAGGGDGTVSAVASALAGTDAVLGVLPLGTRNHFAKDLRIPLDIPEAVRTIVTGRSVAADAGDVNGRLFINNSSVGIYPRIVWEREKEQRKGRGKSTAFALAVLRVWRRYRRVRVVIRGDSRNRIVRTPFVFVGNNEYELEGVKLGARRALDGGILHVCMAPGMTRLAVAGVLVSALAGGLDGVERFESHRTTEFSIEAWRRRLPMSLDGELTLVETPLRYRIRPKALRVLVP
jgi:diacylglycerol kinase family enzyme